MTTPEIPDFALNNKYKLANILVDSEVDEPWDDRIQNAPGYRANLISSEATVTADGIFTQYLPTGWHRPLIDLDMDAALLPSSTPGHWHLYIDKTMPWEQYEKLLNVLYEVGIIEAGVWTNAVKQKFTTLRLPGIDKYDHKANNPFPEKLVEPVTEADKLRNEIQELEWKLARLEAKNDPSPF